MPSVTIITTALNCADTLEATIQSVLSQSYPNIEYIVVFSESIDGTEDIINRHKKEIGKVIIDEAKGIYSVLNCGLRAASGEIVGILNSDDLYADREVIGRVASEFAKRDLDAIWGDLLYVGRKNTGRIIRYWRSSEPLLRDFKRGWMPPHPALFIRKNIFEEYGLYETGFRFSSDYEMALRLFYKNKIKGCYIPGVFIKMRQGGRGDRNLVAKTIEDYRIAKSYGLGFRSVLLKKMLKASQFISRPKKGEIQKRLDVFGNICYRNMNKYNMLTRKDKRKFLRLNAYHLVRYKLASQKDWQVGVTSIRDISAGGVCLRSEDRIPKDAILQIRINFPKLSAPLFCSAKVVWVKKIGKVNRFEMGLEFFEIEDLLRKEIIQRIDYVHRRSE